MVAVIKVRWVGMVRHTHTVLVAIPHMVHLRFLASGACVLLVHVYLDGQRHGMDMCIVPSWVRLSSKPLRARVYEINLAWLGQLSPPQ